MKFAPIFAPLLMIAAPASAAPLVAEAGAARYMLAADETLMLDALDPASRVVFASALGDDFGVAGNFWTDIMAGALQLHREDGDHAEVLWFNPLFDVGIASRWQRVGEGWQALAAVPVTGESLRGESSILVSPDWMESEGLAAGLETSAQGTWQIAEASDWFSGDVRGAGAVALSRALSARASISEMAASPGMDQARRQLRALLVEQRDSDLPPALRDALTRIGADARLSLRPVTALFRAEGWTVALQSPDAPRITWLAHFGASASGPANLLAIETVDLGRGE